MYYKEKDICKHLNISRTTFWRLKKNGLPIKKIGNTFRYDIKEVENWVSNEQFTTYENVNKTNGEAVLNFDNGIVHKDKIRNNYKLSFSFLLEHNRKYLNDIISINDFNELEKILLNIDDRNLDNQEVVKRFSTEYLSIIRKNFIISKNTQSYNLKLNNFIDKNDNKIKIIWGDCLEMLKKLETESIQLMVTSPPYYNAREYSQWESLDKYLEDMTEIINESYRVLDNHRVWVFNVGDIFDNDNLKTKSVWGKRRIPLGAYFIQIFENAGFEFVDDIIWNKGEVESKRHMNNGVNYPLYQYPLNCYEHLLVFHKHRLDKTKIPCPICGTLNVNGNTQSEIGVQSWECKNEKCFLRSPNNRGKRFSLRTNIMQYKHDNNNENLIEKSFLKKWRKDIVDFPPKIKINSKGRNILGHSAPFPIDIPLMAVKYYTYVGEKVLDPFAGSFTSCVVAKKLNRIGIGVEINEKLFRSSVIKNLKNEFPIQTSSEIFSEYSI